MNCYYSNLIEGHKTTPRDIERALRQDFSADETQRNHQQLGFAHIAVEKFMVERLSAETVDVYGSEFLCWLHREFYQRLPEPLHWAKTSSGKAYRVEPGGLRHFMVDVGRHTPPQFDALLDSSVASISSTTPRKSSRPIASPPSQRRITGWLGSILSETATGGSSVSIPKP